MGILRILLAISVIMAHLCLNNAWTLVGGAGAVQTFFVISGFYMSMILNEKYIDQPGSFKIFIISRFLRLYPVYLVVLVLTVISCLLISAASNGQNIPIFGTYLSVRPDFPALLYLTLTNFAIWGQDIVMFMGIHAETGSLYFTGNFWNTSPGLYTFLFIQQGWSLALELTFYLLAPFILRKRLWIVLAFIMISFLLRLVIYYILDLHNDPWTYRFFPTEVLFFLSGNISYRIYLFFKGSVVSRRLGWTVFASLILFIIEYGSLPATSQVIFQYTIKDVVYFLSVISTIPVLFIHFKDSKADRNIGDLSYPVYLSHLLIVRMLDYYHLADTHRALVVITITIGFSWLLHRFIVVPVERVRQKRIGKLKLNPFEKPAPLTEYVAE